MVDVLYGHRSHVEHGSNHPRIGLGYHAAPLLCACSKQVEVSSVEWRGLLDMEVGLNMRMDQN